LTINILENAELGLFAPEEVSFRGDDFFYSGGDDSFADPGDGFDTDRYYWTRPEGALYMSYSPVAIIASLMLMVAMHI